MDNQFSFFNSWIFWLFPCALTLYGIFRTGNTDFIPVIAGFAAYTFICALFVLIYKAFSKPKEQK